MLRLEDIAKHIRQKTVKIWGEILSSLGEVKEQLQPEKIKKQGTRMILKVWNLVNVREHL
jgi:hypothetical protein